MEKQIQSLTNEYDEMEKGVRKRKLVKFHRKCIDKKVTKNH